MNTGFHFEEGTALIIVEGQDIFIILALMAAAIALEIFLGVKKDGRLGLVLPGLMLLRSVVKLIVWMIQVSAYSSVSACVSAGKLYSNCKRAAFKIYNGKKCPPFLRRAFLAQNEGKLLTTTRNKHMLNKNNKV